MLSLEIEPGVSVRALEPWQATEFLAHLDAIRDHLRPWIPFASRVNDVDAARDLLQKFADWQATDTGRIYGLWVDGALAGGTLFRTFDVPSGVCEVGVWLAPAYEGRGLISRTVRLMIDWAVRERGMSRVEWRTDPRNVRSAAVAQRLGFTREGVLRSSFVVGGERTDTEVWALLASDWAV